MISVMKKYIQERQIKLQLLDRDQAVVKVKYKSDDNDIYKVRSEGNRDILSC